MRGTLVAITILLGRKTTRPYHTHTCVCALFYFLKPHQSASHARENRIDRRPPTMFDLSTFFSSFRQESAHGWSVRECVGRRHLRCLVSFMISYRHWCRIPRPNMLHWNLFLREATKFRRKKKNVEQMSKWSRWNKSSVFQILGSADWGSPYDGFRSSLIPGRRLRVRALLPFPIRRWPLDLPPSLS